MNNNIDRCICKECADTERLCSRYCLRIGHNETHSELKMSSYDDCL